MKILICASECSPIVKVGGLGDVIGSLPKSLAKLGADVRIVIPAYKDVIEKFNGAAQQIHEYALHFAETAHKVTVYQATLPNSNVILYLLHNAEFLSNGGVYFDPSAFASSQLEIDRFAFFSKAVVETFVTRDEIFFPDIVHCNDWHTGIIPQLIKAEARYIELKRPATIFTIHNLANQGISDLKVTDRLDLPSLKASTFVKWDSLDDNLDFVLQGILGADVVNTVSPSYAEEIKTVEFGENLNEIIKAREGRVFGILNGIDYSVFNPEEDTYLHKKYALTNVSTVLSAKSENKEYLRNLLKLNQSDAPLMGLVARLTNQKGVDLIVASANDLVRRGFQLIILGTGDPVIENLIKGKLKNTALSGNFAGIIEFNEKLARLVYAASDIFLVPSRFEPCGLTQMIAMRYGAVPLVRGVGGLKDTVHNKHDGFVFTEFTQKDFISAVIQAREAYMDETKWKEIVTRCIEQDFSWDKSAKEYLNLYGRALKFAAAV